MKPTKLLMMLTVPPQLSSCDLSKWQMRREFFVLFCPLAETFQHQHFYCCSFLRLPPSVGNTGLLQQLALPLVASLQATPVTQSMKGRQALKARRRQNKHVYIRPLISKHCCLWPIRETLITQSPFSRFKVKIPRLRSAVNRVSRIPLPYVQSLFWVEESGGPRPGLESTYFGPSSKRLQCP